MERLFHKLGRYFLGGWRLAVLDMQKGRWIVEAAASNLHYLKGENANGRHILMQPMDASRYLLADDLSQALICRHHRHADGTWKPGRMVIETSPRNYQVWIHSERPLSLMEKRYWLKKLMNDPGADPNNRWGRCPGFRNRKDKHRNACGRYPLARLLWIDWKREAQIPQIPLEPPVHSKPFSHQPQRGGVCRHTKKLSRSDFDRGNESATDFSYALALARGGHTEDQIRSRILSERACWKNHQGERKIHQYLDRTISRASAIVAKT